MVSITILSHKTSDCRSAMPMLVLCYISEEDSYSDQAASKVGHETDQLMQTIKANFASHTIITTAHKQNTIREIDEVTSLDPDSLVHLSEYKKDNTFQRIWDAQRSW